MGVPIKTLLNDLYLDWVNNYITIEKMSEVHGLSREDMGILIDLGRKINHAEYDAE